MIVSSSNKPPGLLKFGVDVDFGDMENQQEMLKATRGCLELTFIENIPPIYRNPEVSNGTDGPDLLNMPDNDSDLLDLMSVSNDSEIPDLMNASDNESDIGDGGAVEDKCSIIENIFSSTIGRWYEHLINCITQSSGNLLNQKDVKDRVLQLLKMSPSRNPGEGMKALAAQLNPVHFPSVG